MIAMRISKHTLLDMGDANNFMGTYNGYVTEVLAQARLFPRVSPPRLLDAYGAWRNDLKRVELNEPKLHDGLDHFKQCGHLAFWIRRMSPLVETVDLTENIADAPGNPLTENEKKFRELLYGYANEYLAFDFGFQFCKFYEIHKKEGSSDRAKKIILTPDYYKTICDFMKYKSVSPHSLFMIYKSLFLN
jgi:hypothetical protein